MIEAILGTLGRIAGFILERLPIHGNVRLRLDVHEGWLAAVGGSMLMSYSGEIRTYNRGRHRLTIRKAGWIASDGEELIAGRGDSTLDPGDPEDVRRASVIELTAFAREHRGLRTAFVLLAGEDKPRTAPVTNQWMAKVLDLAAKPTVEPY